MDSQSSQPQFSQVPQQVPPHLAHVVNPQYALAPPPSHISHPISGIPLPMHIQVPHPPHVSHHLHHQEHHQPPPQHPQPPHLSQSQPHHHHHHHPPPPPPPPPPPLSAPPPPQHPQLPSLHPLPIPHYYDPAAKIALARLEAELEKARHENDRLRAKLAEYEKERAKIDTPKVQSRYWTPSEHKLFIEALQKFGPKDVRAIANYVGTRNATQVRTHAQKYFLRVAREAKNGSALQAARKRSMSESDLARVGRSVRTPPGSPMRERLQPPPPLDARMTEVDSTTLPPAPQPAHPLVQTTNQRPLFNPMPPTKVENVTVSSIKPPTPIPPSVTAGKPPPSRTNIADNTGMNLLSLVASERKMETEKPGR